MSGALIDLDTAERAICRAVREAVAPFAEFAGPSLTARQAAAYLSISLRLFEQIVSSGEIRPVRITPRCRRFLRETLDSYLRAHLR